MYVCYFFLPCFVPNTQNPFVLPTNIFEGLCSFPIAAVTNYHKQITQIYYLTGSGGEKSKIGFMEPKSRCQQGYVLLEALDENLFPCLFQLLETACIAWCMSHPSISKGHPSVFCSHCHISYLSSFRTLVVLL